MPRLIGSGLSRREREILDIINRLEKATVADIEEEMADPPTNSAVRSILRVLKQKGHIQLEERGRHYVYSASIPRPVAGQFALKNVIRTFFAGSLSSAVKTFLTDADAEMSEDELSQLADLIERARKNGSQGTSAS